MDVYHARCCGLDVHKKRVTACLLTPGQGAVPRKQVRTFPTMQPDLERLRDWLVAEGCTHVALESTGIYWVPVWNVLEEALTLALVNPEHFKRVPGRKTDVTDSEWLADLLRHGLLRPSFVPAREQRELRELTRYRTTLIRERSAEVNRLHKTLEGANLKLGAVVSDLLGVSAREMLAQLVAGETEPTVLAALARGRMRDKLAQLEQALVGRVGTHQRFLLARQLAHIDSLEALIADLDAEVSSRLAPFAELLARLDGIPGVGQRVAEVIASEVGTDVAAFPSADDLASWGGFCPGNRQSAGRRGSGRTRKGNKWLRAALVEAAQAAGHSQTTYLGAQYRRLRGRRGSKRAAVAVAHSIVVSAWHMIDAGTTYDDLGGQYFDERAQEAVERQCLRRLERLGNTVTIQRAEGHPLPA
jgi:transposase